MERITCSLQYLRENENILLKYNALCKISWHKFHVVHSYCGMRNVKTIQSSRNTQREIYAKNFHSVMNVRKTKSTTRFVIILFVFHECYVAFPFFAWI